jgi:hypothetical protein
MKNKEKFLKDLSYILDKVEDKEANIDYFSISLSNYQPDKKTKLSYFQVDIKYNIKTEEFKINDRSEFFKCCMGDEDCTERGYCNGDC